MRILYPANKCLLLRSQQPVSGRAYTHSCESQEGFYAFTWTWCIFWRLRSSSPLDISSFLTPLTLRIKCSRRSAEPFFTMPWELAFCCCSDYHHLCPGCILSLSKAEHFSNGPLSTVNPFYTQWCEISLFPPQPFRNPVLRLLITVLHRRLEKFRRRKDS